MQSQSTFNPLTPHFTVLDIWRGFDIDRDLPRSGELTQENFSPTDKKAPCGALFSKLICSLEDRLPSHVNQTQQFLHALPLEGPQSG